MRAVVYDAVGATPELREVPAPACPADGLLVEVAATGVCRSDWHAWQGHDPVDLPHIPGHELAGRVAEVGREVRRLRVGERVTVPFVSGCGACPTCRSGNAQVCPQQTQPGFTGPGSFAELVALHAADANVVRLPDSVSFLTAASLGCRFATAYRALTAHGRVGLPQRGTPSGAGGAASAGPAPQRPDRGSGTPGSWVAVYGCGGVGLSAVMIAVALGARVVAVDVSPAALGLARQLGASAVVDSSVDDPVAAVREVTGGGAQVSMDALGSAGTAAASVRSLARRGRHLQVGLLLGEAATPPLPMDLVVAHELEIYGSHGMAAHEYPAMLELVTAGAVQPDRLIGSVIDLAAAPAALMAMSHPSAAAGMTVIALSPEGQGRAPASQGNGDGPGT